MQAVPFIAGAVVGGVTVYVFHKEITNILKAIKERITNALSYCYSKVKGFFLEVFNRAVAGIKRIAKTCSSIAKKILTSLKMALDNMTSMCQGVYTLFLAWWHSPSGSTLEKTAREDMVKIDQSIKSSPKAQMILEGCHVKRMCHIDKETTIGNMELLGEAAAAASA